MKHRFTVLYGTPVAIIIAVLFVYSNVIQGEFQFDDEVFINSSLAGITPASYLNRAGLAGVLSGQRILTLLTFALNYQIGGLNVSGYHIFNIFLHASAVILVFCFILSLLSLVVDISENPSRTIYPALFVAALFALHPLQTQAVSYVVQRGEVLASIFYLATLISLLSYTKAGGAKIFLWWLASFVFFIAGWISKEIIITVPIAYLLCVFYIDDKKYIKRALWGVLPYLAGGIALASVKLISVRGAKDVGFSSFAPGISVYVMTQMKVVFHYVLLFLIPSGQNIDHDVPLITSLLSLEGMLLLVFWFVLLAGSLFILVKYRGSSHYYLRSAAFGLIWAVVILLPTSSIIPIVDPMYEHRMYLSLLGLSLAAVFLVLLVSDSLSPAVRKTFLTFMLIIILPGMGYVTYERNRVWITMESLWLDASQKSPRKSRPFNNLGNCYLLKGRYLSAVDSYRKAISLDPSNSKSYFNIAIALKQLGQMEDAFKYYQKYLDLVNRERLENK